MKQSIAQDYQTDEKTDIRYLTVEESAQYLRLSKHTLYNLTRFNRIKCHRPSGRKLLFIKSELDEWVLNQNPQPKSYDQMEIEAIEEYFTRNSRKKPARRVA